MSESVFYVNDAVFNIKYDDTVSPLAKACASGNLKQIKKLLKSGKSPQNVDNRGWTSIHYCVASNQLQALELILKLKQGNKKYLVNLATWENITPLLLALYYHLPVSMVKFLLDAGASPNICTHMKLSPLHLACCQKGNLHLVKLLVEHGADVNIQQEISKVTPLHVAVCYAHDVEIIKYLMKISNLELQNVNDRCAFSESCFLNFMEAVEVFLEFKPSLANQEGEVPPLAYAGYVGNLRMAKLLIKYGADVNAKCRAIVKQDFDTLLNVKNYSPIHSCLNNLKLFKFMLNLVDPMKMLELNSKFSSFAFFVLIYSENIEFYKTLIQSHFPVELKTITDKDLMNHIESDSISLSQDVLDVKKFLSCFKYNFHLEVEEIFKQLANSLIEEKDYSHASGRKLKFLLVLAKMGFVISSQLLNNIKSSYVFTNDIVRQESDYDEMMEEITSLLTEPFLSLQHMCRTVVRRYVRSLTETDWSAYLMIEKSNLPSSVKEFLFFDAS